MLGRHCRPEYDTAVAVAKELASSVGEIIALSLDVSDTAACNRVVDEIAAKLGGLDYLVNSAGSFIAKGANASDADWQRIFGTNVRGNAAMVSAAARWMKLRGGGAIVNIGSVSGRVAQAERWTYNATKGAIAAITRCQALDLAPAGIRVNCVEPGWIWTREVEGAAGGDRGRWEPVWGRYSMQRRLGEASEVAKPVAFLLSDAASFITGAEIPVDGGYLAMGPEGLGNDSVFAGSN